MIWPFLILIDFRSLYFRMVSQNSTMIRHLYFALASLLLHRTAQSFVSLPKALCSRLLTARHASLQEETPQEREERMKLVRDIQRSFYREEKDDGERTLVVATSDFTFEHVPLYRAQWTELPGYQNMLHMDDPQHTNMFRRILQGPKPWWYGHMYLPGGRENPTNPLYRRAEASQVGTLMQISHVLENDHGQLRMIVQAVERFQVVAKSQEVPFPMATVKLLADTEFLENADENHAEKAMKDFKRWSEWEVRETQFDDRDANGCKMFTWPLASYDFELFPDEMALDKVYSSSKAETRDIDIVQAHEDKIWIELDARCCACSKGYWARQRRCHIHY